MIGWHTQMIGWHTQSVGKRHIGSIASGKIQAATTLPCRSLRPVSTLPHPATNWQQLRLTGRPYRYMCMYMCSSI
eukprot:359834-Chlamydomonas_euryale.AAC.10